VRYRRMISCLHSSEPVSNEEERERRLRDPIWNNRIPFAIVFLSVSLFLRPMDTKYKRVSVIRACVRALKRSSVRFGNARAPRAWTEEDGSRKGGKVEYAAPFFV